MKNEDVVRAWVKGIPSSSGHIRTDGYNLFSYDLKIGYTVRDKKIVYGYTAGHGRFISKTTSRHVRTALQYANDVEKWKGEKNER